MIAAGHPDLYFELDSFSAVMPALEVAARIGTGQAGRGCRVVGMREWSAGQAVQLRAAMEPINLAPKNERFDKKDVWPEYSELSCFCMPPCAGAGERQLAAGAWIHRASSRRSGMEQLALCGVPIAGQTD